MIANLGNRVGPPLSAPAPQNRRAEPSQPRLNGAAGGIPGGSGRESRAAGNAKSRERAVETMTEQRNISVPRPDLSSFEFVLLT